jgi:enoyl-CoA hydratase/carnithine racemase
MSAIEFNLHNQIGILTVNRPTVRNALNWEAMADFAAAIEQAHATPDLRALIVTGAGRAFISGGDVAELHDYKTEDDGRRMITLMGDALNRLAELPCITIAAQEGPARGGGCEVALACDWWVAAEDADIGFVQIRLGLTTGWGGAVRLFQLVGYARALDLLTLGRVISATEAHDLGIVTHLTPPDKPLQSALNFADALTQYDSVAMRVYKRILKAAHPSLAEAQAIERAEFPKLWVAEAHVKAVEKFLAER